MDVGSQDRSPPRRVLPTGTVTFLFTDIEGSTVRWDRHPGAMRDAVRVHDALMRDAVARYDGHVFKTIGDAFCVAFRTPGDAARAALAAQRAFAAQDFSAVDGVAVRMAIHLGESDERDGDYFGPPLNRVARLVSIGHGGQILLSHVAAEVVRAALPPDATLHDRGEHRLKDLIDAERVAELVATDLAREHPPLRSLSVLHNNLPLQLGTLVGRDGVVGDVVATLARSRVVTLCGTGGIGKTRIAVQAAAESLDAFPDGVWFVDLAPLATGAFVAETVAAALELPIAVGRGALESIVGFVRARRLLVVLDNCEHVVADAAATVAAIAGTAPDVRVLATSREPLGVPGECVVRVPTLEVPPRGAEIGADAAMRFGAVALFVARARAADARFVMTDATASVVCEIVDRLDGIALAIELAAARVKVLGIVALGRRLDERFRLLTGGARTALPRQRTMRALMDWSWEILTDAERTTLRRLGIFAGGWTLEAAEAVCADEMQDAPDVLDTIGILIDKSLVATEPGLETTRSRLLETTRAYAVEKLAESGERDGIALRHATAMVDFCARMHGTYDGNNAWFAEMEAELDNARAALDWSLANGRPELAARIVGRALSGYWWYRAPNEGLAWAQRSLALLDAAREPTLVAALYGIVGSYLSGARSAEAYESAVAILSPLVAAGTSTGPYTRLTYVLGGLGSALLSVDRVAEARDAIERCLALYRANGETRTRGYANVLSNRGTALARAGEVAAGRASFDEAHDLFSSLGELPGVAIVALDRARVEFASGDYAVARELIRAAAAIYEARGIALAAVAYGESAACAYVAGDVEGAREEARVAVVRAAAFRVDVPLAALAIAGTIAASEDAAIVAARLLGYVDAVVVRETRSTDAFETVVRSRLATAVRDALTSDVARTHAETGARLTNEEVRALATAALEPACARVAPLRTA